MKKKLVVALLSALSLTVVETGTVFAMDIDFINDAGVLSIEEQNRTETSAEKVHQVYLSILKPGTEVKAGTDWHEIVRGVTSCKECGFQGNVSDVQLVSGSLEQVGDATLVLKYSAEENGVVHKGTTSATYKVVPAVNPDQKYKITAEQPANGTLTLSSETAKEGETVTIKVEPEEGYHVTTVSVTGVAVSEQENNTYIFQMPARDVTVTAEIVSDSIQQVHEVYISALKPESDVLVGTDWHEVITGITKCKKCGFKGSKENVKLVSGSLDKVGRATLELTYAEEHDGVLHEAVTRKFTYNVVEKVEESYSIHANQELDKGQISLDKTTAKEGESVNVSVTANDGYELEGIRVISNGKDVAVSDNGNGNYSFVMPAGDVEVSAAFRETVKPVEKYKVNVSNSEGGIVEVDTNEAEAGATVAITATAKNGYELAGVNVSSNGIPVSVNDNGNGTFTFIMPAGDVEVSATFVEKEAPAEKYSIKKGKEDTTRGTFSFDKTEAKEGETVTVTVSPKEGYVLQQIWAGGDTVGRVQLTKLADNTYAFVMPAGDVTVYANFVKESAEAFNISSDVSGNGSIEVDTQAFEGAVVTFTAKPNGENVKVDSVSVKSEDGSEAEVTDHGDGTYSFTMPKGNVVVSVKFVEEIPWTDLEPSTPVEPENPEIPWIDLEPSTPVEPEKPENPDQKPEQKPEVPTTPEENKENVQTQETKKKGTSPKTGDTASALPVAGAGLASLGVALATILKKRK